MATNAALRWCAVYTRKSSEEGMEQEFNSLHAQREAGAAYIKSQQHEGWRLLAANYDDGGYSGGNLERPAPSMRIGIRKLSASSCWLRRTTLPASR